jgi:hypothetical protein
MKEEERMIQSWIKIRGGVFFLREERETQGGFSLGKEYDEVNKIDIERV